MGCYQKPISSGPQWLWDRDSVEKNPCGGVKESKAEVEAAEELIVAEQEEEGRQAGGEGEGGEAGEGGRGVEIGE